MFWSRLFLGSDSPVFTYLYARKEFPEYDRRLSNSTENWRRLISRKVSLVDGMTSKTGIAIGTIFIFHSVPKKSHSNSTNVTNNLKSCATSLLEFFAFHSLVANLLSFRCNVQQCSNLSKRWNLDACAHTHTLSSSVVESSTTHTVAFISWLTFGLKQATGRRRRSVIL